MIDYMITGRPSFARFAARFQKEFGREATREDYDKFKKLADNQLFARPSGAVPSVEKPASSDDLILVVPDSQIGFLRHGNDFVATHDHGCLELTLTVAEVMQPDVIVLQGDMLDLPAFSKYKKNESMRYQSQRSIDYFYAFLARLRAAAPSSRIVYLFGNHEARYENSLSELNDEYSGIMLAGTSKRVNSLAFILRLDELGIEYTDVYGKSVYIRDIEFTHGNLVGANTASKYLANSVQSVVYGHVHKTELAYRTLHKNGTTSTIFAFCPGTTCDPDTTPPTPARNRNWQQALGVIEAGVPRAIPFVKDGERTSVSWKGLTYMV